MMGNIGDALTERTTDPDFLQSVVDKVAAGYSILQASPPDARWEGTCVLSDSDMASEDNCTTHRHENPTIVVQEKESPYTWRFWPEPADGVWLGEFHSDFDSPDQWTAVFRDNEHDDAPQLALDADAVALWIVALTGPEV